MVNSDAQANGDTTLISSPQPAAKQTPQPVECIDLEDEEEVILIDEGPPAKRQKTASRESSQVPANDAASMPSNSTTTPSTKQPENEKKNDASSYEVLLERLNVHVQDALKEGKAVDRKLLDTLLSAINVQVQNEPYFVRKLILEKQLVLPNSISFPPSQVVNSVIEHDADMQISKVLNRMFGQDRNKMTDAEKRERQQFKKMFTAPAMTRALMEVGQDLVQETTYSDIVHARNLPEMPKNVDTYKQVAAQLKPVWENLRDKNSTFKLKTYTCSVCGFKTENMLLMSEHKQTLHIGENKKIQCGMCPEYNTSGTRMHRHYIEKHGLVPLIPEEPPSKIQCSLCDQDFPFKGQRDAHMKTCKREVHRLMTIQASKMPEHSAVINRWLWTRPPPDPVMEQSAAARQQANDAQQRSAQAQRVAQPAPTNRPQATKTPQQATPKPNQANATPNALGAFFANQQFQEQLKKLDPSQKQKIEQLLRSKQGHFPANVISTIQSQLRSSQSPAQPQAAAGALAKNLAQINQLNTLSKMTPQMLQQLSRTLQQQQQQASANRNASAQNSQRKSGGNQLGASSSSTPVNRNTLPQLPREGLVCEICDEKQNDKRVYLDHLQKGHNVLRGRNAADLDSGPPLACSRCRERFWSYDGLERHLVMNHSLVTSDLLAKAQNKLDGGRCKQCKKSFAFNILQHLASDHGAKLCSAEIMFSCDVCAFKCQSYVTLESHLSTNHPKNAAGNKNGIH